jgi:hypothetical protein
MEMETKSDKTRLGLPNEIWYNIIKWFDIVTLSEFTRVNKSLNNLVNENLWLLVDNLHRITNTILIPKTIFTFNKYRYLIDWNTIVLYNQQHNKIIPEETITWIPDIQDLEMICIYQTFSENLVRMIYPRISWPNLLSKQTVPLDIINIMIDGQSDYWELSISDWYNIWLYQPIDYDFIVNNIDNVQWHPLSSNKNAVSYQTINRFGNNIIWQEFTKHSLHEDVLEYFIEKFDFVCWSNISRYTNMSASFMKKHIKFLDIGSIIRYQTIPEWLLNEIIQQLRPFEDFDLNFYMPSIATYQNISKKFILRYKNYIPLKTIVRNTKISRSLIHELYSNPLYYGYEGTFCL